MSNPVGPWPDYASCHFAHFRRFLQCMEQATTAAEQAMCALQMQVDDAECRATTVITTFPEEGPAEIDGDNDPDYR